MRSVLQVKNEEECSAVEIQYKENNIWLLLIVVVIIMEIRIVPQEKPQTTDRKWRAGTA